MERPQQSESVEAGRSPIWPMTTASGVPLGEVFGDLASWKSTPGRETTTKLPGSPWLPRTGEGSDLPTDAPATEAGPDAGVAASGNDATTDDATAAEATTGADPVEGSLLSWLQVAVRATQQAVGQSAWRHNEVGLGAAMGLIGQLRNCLDRVEVAVVAEAESQGAADGRGLSSVDWLVDAAGADAPKPDIQHVTRLLNVAKSMEAGQPAADVFREAVESGAMPIAKADLIARFVCDVHRVADADALAADVTSLIEAASDNENGRGLTVKELRRAITFATQLIKPAKDLEDNENRRRLARSLVKTGGPAGMSRYQLTLDPEGAAIIDAAVQALSGPVKGADGQPDPRPAATRRADALLELVRRAVSSPGSEPKSEKTQVIVTIPLAHLIAQCRGAGVAMNGDLLSPAVVRRMACDARIIPMVLGSKGEVLDIGLGDRFFTPTQRKAIWHRDHHCTFPGCTVPAEWCDAHHVQWWSRGGPTDFNNAALLCGRHHTIVHQRDSTATVTDTGVTWHL